MDTSEEQIWHRAYAALGEVLELAEEERTAYLRELNFEPEVQERLQSLLDASDAEGPLDRSLEDLGVSFFRDSPSVAKPERIGQWHLGPEIGRGGMGVVFRATREFAGFKQIAALKLLRFGFSDPASVARFEREQQILARLDHPHIAGLIDGGVTAEGVPYLVLREVVGAPIDRATEERSSNASEIVDWMVKICQAVAYAHSNLIVHRDLKPANILVDGNSEVHLLDFGVAKLLEGETAAEGTTRVLTPGYGAPEQRTGGAITTATDIYGLGAVLFRLLTGQTPPESAPVSVLTSSFPPSLPGLDGDLSNIVLMALRPEPERRYASAEALAEDLRRWRRQLPVTATPDSFAYRLRKLVQRHRGAVAVGLFGVLSLVIGSGLALWQTAMAREEAQRAQAATEEASRQLETAKAVTDFLISAFQAADPAANESQEVTAREILSAGIDGLENSLEMAPEVRRDLRSALGEVSFRLGDLEHTETLLAPNLKIPEDPSTLSQGDIDHRVKDLRFAARAALRQGKADVTEERFAQALALSSWASKTEQLELEAYYATTLVEVGRPEEALERIEIALDAKAEGAVSPTQWAGLLGTRAAAQLRVGRLTDSKASAEEALEIYRSLGDSVLEGQGWVGPKTEQGKMEALLAAIEGDLGNLDRAIVLAERALATLEPILGTQHLRLLAVRNDLATFLKNQGRFAESAAQLEEILTDQEDIMGPDHPYLATTRFNLARALDRAGDADRNPAASLAAALDHYRQSVERALADPRAFGGQLPLFEVVYGEALGRAGRFSEAEAQIRSGLDRLGDKPNSSNVAKLRVLYASFLNDRGRHEEARSVAEPAEKVLLEKQGDKYRWHPLAQIQLGRSLAPTRSGEARRLLGTALDSLRAGTFHRQYVREIALGEATLRRLVAQGESP